MRAKISMRTRFVYLFILCACLFSSIAQAEEQTNAQDPCQSRIIDQNNELIKKLSTYQPDITSENDFIKDGWSASDPYYGKIGIVQMSQKGEGHGTTVYSLGIYCPALNPHDDPQITRLADETFSAFIKLKSFGDMQFSLPHIFPKGSIYPMQPITLGELVFENGMLKSIVQMKVRK